MAVFTTAFAVLLAIAARGELSLLDVAQLTGLDPRSGVPIPCSPAWPLGSPVLQTLVLLGAGFLLGLLFQLWALVVVAAAWRFLRAQAAYSLQPSVI